MQNSEILSYLGIGITMLGIFLAVWFFKESKRERRPRYALRSVNFIDEKASSIPSLQVNYNGVSIERLSATKLLLWNAGSETINGKDISEKAPLLISVHGENRFLYAGIIGETSLANSAAAKMVEDGRSVQLDFDFLDRHQGLVVALLHTGKSSEDIFLEGTIKGVPSGIERETPGERPILLANQIELSAIAGLISSAGIYFMADYLIVEMGAPLALALSIFVFVIIGIFATLMIIKVARRKAKVPKSLQSFLDSIQMSEFGAS